MRRRDFITLAGAAAAFPRTALAQQAPRLREIRVFWNTPTATPDGDLLRQALAERGWVDGRTVTISERFDAPDPSVWPVYLTEMRRSPPDLIIPITATVLIPTARFTHTIPIVYWGGSDPAASGVVSNLARPEGNITGDVTLLSALGGKWLDLLLDIAPGTREVAFVRDRRAAPPLSTDAYLESAALAGRARGVAVIDTGVASAGDIAQAIAAVGAKPNTGVILQPDGLFMGNRPPYIAALAANRVPAVAGYEPFTSEGGLASYVADQPQHVDTIAGYVDAIFRGEPISNLPIREPRKLDFYFNLRAARAIGLDAPTSLLARVDRLVDA